MKILADVLLVVFCGFLDRLGGGGFFFLGADENHWLGQGHKWARRYVLPLVILAVASWRFGFTWERAALAAAVAGLLSMNLKEIVEWDFDEIALKPVVIALLLKIMGFTWWTLLIPAWWALAVFWSNKGILGHKIGWHWVELIRGGLIGRVIGFLTLCSIALLVSPGPVRAQVDDIAAVKTIVGEAADQGYRGMLAVAEVIRQRDSVKPFCASRRPDLDDFVKRQGSAVEEAARRAWENSRWSNVTNGATHYATKGSRPDWRPKMRVVARVGDHVFYRDRK